MVQFLVYGALGWSAEIVWTAMWSLLSGERHDVAYPGGRVRLSREERLRLLGHTYLWMFPVYGFGGLLFGPCHEALRAWPWFARGLVWTLAIFAVEYLAGRLLARLTGRCPWDYSYSRYHLHGFIRFDYAPVWFGFGLLLERVHDALCGLAA